MTPSPLDQPRGLTSVCSAHPWVIEAALLQALEDGGPALIEATCNQVNQDGGYTGLTPAAFRDQVLAIADRAGLPRDRVILGGDHLGPNPWRHLPAHEAMARAAAMVVAYAEAGYGKIHLDTSMGCAGEPACLPDEVTAERAARLASVAEEAAGHAGVAPRYVIGTEVPMPGGALEDTLHLQITQPDAAAATYEVHRRAFADAGVASAFERVVALVVQPGVEFGHASVAVYQPESARELSASLRNLPGLVFEAHSTDYQPLASLSALVRDGFAILKVGPGLTFALREALYAADLIAAVLRPSGAPPLAAVMEEVMLADPAYWRSHYRGTPGEQRVLRHYSYSDRIRYYWPAPAAQRAVGALLARLEGCAIPETVVSQFLPLLYERVASGRLPGEARRLITETVRDVLRVYATACRTRAAEA